MFTERGSVKHQVQRGRNLITMRTGLVKFAGPVNEQLEVMDGGVYDFRHAEAAFRGLRFWFLLLSKMN